MDGNTKDVLLAVAALAGPVAAGAAAVLFAMARSKLVAVAADLADVKRHTNGLTAALIEKAGLAGELSGELRGRRIEKANEAERARGALEGTASPPVPPPSFFTDPRS